jgi:alkylation response protein AidB-like acyl-CoA dehydrogenase
MDFAFSAEQRELGSVLRAFLADQWPEPELRRLMADPLGWDRKVLARCAGEIGLQGLAVPERFGGAGYGIVELGVGFTELGRALAGGPLFASVALATTALLGTGDEGACAELLPGLAAGTTVATLALVEQDGAGDPRSVRTTARREGTGWVLDGTKEYVLDGAGADLLLVVAAGPNGPGLYAVDVAGAGDAVVRTPLDTLDPTRRQARIVLSAAPGRLVGADGAAEPAVAHALRIGAVLLAAEQVGGAEKVLEAAVEYAGVREQFGRPIGSFQAVKHRCADMLLRVEAARSASAYALWAADNRPAEFPVAAAIAKSYCSEAYSFCAGQGMQIHGGMGFTWEHPAHLHLRRAKSTEALLGSPTQHRAELAALAGIG